MSGIFVIHSTEGYVVLCKINERLVRREYVPKVLGHLSPQRRVRATTAGFGQLPVRVGVDKQLRVRKQNPRRTLDYFKGDCSWNAGEVVIYAHSIFKRI